MSVFCPTNSPKNPKIFILLSYVANQSDKSSHPQQGGVYSLFTSVKLSNNQH